MKKLGLLLVVFCFISSSFAQKQAKDLVINPLLYEQFGEAQINQYLQTDFAELFRLNYKMTNFARVAAKMVDGNYQILGYPEQYANQGVVTDEAKIIENGSLNPFLYSLPQDEYKFNVFPLHTSGYYIIVIPKSEYDAIIKVQLGQFGL